METCQHCIHYPVCLMRIEIYKFAKKYLKAMKAQAMSQDSGVYAYWYHVVGKACKMYTTKVSERRIP